ncbi:MAG TPA: hypothetical protein VGN57_04205 [Pirellulaceae bacterium]|jgi:hypothetical protein|nr:hypothetical protein [Pirellulaceae bacterium]
MNTASLTDDDRRDLVAYLDGELPPDEAARIEARMLSDDAYRAEMQALQGTFDLLEDLPISTVGPDFTRTTVEVASIDFRRRPSTSEFDPKRLLPAALLLLSVGLAGAFGFAWQRNRQSLPEREAIREFPILENYDAYDWGGDVEFLRQLRDEGIFDGTTFAAVVPTASPAPEEASAFDPWAEEMGPGLPAIGELTPEQVQTRIDRMGAQEREELASRMDRFEALPPEERRRLRDLHEALLADPEGEELLRLAHQYRQWVSTLTGEDRASLESLSSKNDERLAKIHELMKSEEARQFSRLVDVEVTPEDHQAIVEWLRDYVYAPENERRFRERISPDAWARLQRMGRDDRWIWTIVTYRRYSEGSDRLPLPTPSDEDLNRLSGSLTKTVRDALEKAGDSATKLRLLDEWMRAAVTARMSPNVDKAKLEAFYRDRLTSSVRAELDKLPPEELHRRLEIIYLANERRLREGEKLDVDQLRGYLGSQPNLPFPSMRRDGGPGFERFGPGRGSFSPPPPFAPPPPRRSDDPE